MRLQERGKTRSHFRWEDCVKRDDKWRETWKGITAGTVQPYKNLASPLHKGSNKEEQSPAVLSTGGD